ncbi:hypothetical protein [Streptomyces sp. UG1]
MQPPVAAVIEAHRTLERVAAGLDDQQVAGDSALPVGRAATYSRI